MGKIHNFEKYKFEPFILRIGDLAVTNFFLDEKKRKISAQGHLAKPNFSYFEILKYQPNSYFGREDDYDISQEDGDYYQPKNSRGINIHKSCFASSETAYMIASWNNINHDEMTPDLEFVGGRVFDLPDEEVSIFMNIAKIGQEEIERQLRKNADLFND